MSFGDRESCTIALLHCDFHRCLLQRSACQGVGGMLWPVEPLVWDLFDNLLYVLLVERVDVVLRGVSAFSKWLDGIGADEIRLAFA